MREFSFLRADVLRDIWSLTGESVHHGSFWVVWHCRFSVKPWKVIVKLLLRVDSLVKLESFSWVSRKREVAFMLFEFKWRSKNRRKLFETIFLDHNFHVSYKAWRWLSLHQNRHSLIVLKFFSGHLDRRWSLEFSDSKIARLTHCLCELLHLITGAIYTCSRKILNSSY